MEEDLTLSAQGTAQRSALRHWHTLEDEFVWVLEGEVVLVTGDGEQVLRAGACAGYPAGRRDAHQFVNRGDRPARYLEVGSRIEGDNAFYPDDDLMWVETPDGEYAAHKDGRGGKRAEHEVFQARFGGFHIVAAYGGQHIKRKRLQFQSYI